AIVASGATTAFVGMRAEGRAAPGRFAATLVATGAGFSATKNVTVVVAAAPAGGPRIESFTASADTVLVGDHATLIPVFSGGTGTIDGIGAVTSGVSVDTPPVGSATPFTLTIA